MSMAYGTTESMRKRERFVLSSILLGLGLLVVQFVPTDFRIVAILLFSLASYCISAWVLSKNLTSIEWVTIFPTNAFYALAVALFYFLLPTNFLSRVAVILLFGVGMYALYLMSNIYAIGKSKAIQLLRAAHATHFFFLLLITLFISNFIFSLQLLPPINFLLLSVALFFPILSAVWAVRLQSNITPEVFFTSIVVSLLAGELGFIISFFPIGLWSASLSITVLIYVVYGVIQNLFIERLFPRVLQEYSWLAFFLALSFLLLVEWK